MKEYGKNDMKYLDTLFAIFPSYFKLKFLKKTGKEKTTRRKTTNAIGKLSKNSRSQ